MASLLRFYTVWKFFKDGGTHLTEMEAHSISSSSPAEQDESLYTARNTSQS